MPDDPRRCPRCAELWLLAMAIVMELDNFRLTCDACAAAEAERQELVDDRD